MDPVSLTAAILSVTFNCAKATIGVHNLIRTYEDVPSLLSAVCTDCSLISLTLSRLEMLLLQEDEYASARFADQSVVETIAKALKECEVTLSELDSKATKIMEGIVEEGVKRVWKKVRFMWEESDMEGLSNRLRYHQISLSSLLQVFQSFW
ncbi:hypothetical protein P154DRAFT_216300 [Amniculicola lignicola CBS 123094]|uniref:Fungal N-terminal domain-containing protein n=1 Tax=Amniculicola lignicola CBS 123094 TaxID=1392246 RepID=A0A6A5WFR5_9PLEO|nr:hypothetical protein P154DRAFT_216300 [Amniculicola lignicola CBS 123094]